MSLLIEKSSSQEFIGQGTYGCVYYPGINCMGKKNKRKTITKIQEINFLSKNELEIGLYIKKHIKNYKHFFAPVIKACIVKFQTVEKSQLDLQKCDIFEKYREENRDSLKEDSKHHHLKKAIKQDYHLMHVYYIENKTMAYYYGDYTNYSNFVISLLNHFALLLNSVSLLNQHKIVHNDLHLNNIVINLKTGKPIIIDFGMAFNMNKCYKLNKNYIDFVYLKHFTFDYRVDHRMYFYNIEKRFISFIIYNKSEQFQSDIYDNNAINVLTKINVDSFINDCYTSLVNYENISVLFNENELSEYKKTLEDFYYEFLDKTNYPKYNSIVKYLLDFVYIYNDFYSLAINFIDLCQDEGKRILLENLASDNDKEENYKILIDFFIQLYKKVLHPDPAMRLTLVETFEIYNFIVNYIKNVTLSETTFVANFIIEFTKFLKSKSISIEIVFYKKFAFLNFNLLCNKNMFEFIKSGF